MKNSLEITPSEDGREFTFFLQTIFQEEVITIEKQVLFEYSSIVIGDSVFSVTNMALIDVLPDGSLSDSARSGYGKTIEILSTIAKCVQRFYEYYPNELVYFAGSNPDNHNEEEVTRTRLYRMALSKQENYKLVTQYVDLYGVSKKFGIQPYIPNSECGAFLIKLKK